MVFVQVEGWMLYCIDEFCYLGVFGELVGDMNGMVECFNVVILQIVGIVQYYVVGDMSVCMLLLLGDQVVIIEVMEIMWINMLVINEEICWLV